MLTPDLFNREYTAEVLRTARRDSPSIDAIRSLLATSWTEEHVDQEGDDVRVLHAFVASQTPYHRVRAIDHPGQRAPRTKAIRGVAHFLYDVLILVRGRHVVIAVPFHGLAERFFVGVDAALAGSRTLYETLDITKMVIRLGVAGRTSVSTNSDLEMDVGLTRCHLAYEDPLRRRDLQQVRLVGTNIGASEIYRELVRPILSPSPALTVTPILLGCALFRGGIKTSSATTDRHGNFKVWVGPGLRQVLRLFQLIDAIEGLESVVATTSNLPILQSAGILEMEGQ